MDPGKERGADRATGAAATNIQQTDEAADRRVPRRSDTPRHPARRPRLTWTSHQVAELVELAFSTALHQARTGSLDALEREIQPFEQRVATTARVLESAGRCR